MGTVDFSGVLAAGPSASGAFPGAALNVPLSFGGGPKQFGAATGILTRNVSSPSSFATLDGVGATATVTQGTLLYFKTQSAMVLRLTTDDGVGGTATASVPVQGLFVLEFPTTRPLELLEVQGSGLIEYFVCGAT